MAKNLIDYIPKKYRKHLVDCYKSRQCYGWLYSALLVWEDGYSRMVDEETISDFVWMIKELENDREVEY